MNVRKYVPSVTRERVEFTVPFIGGLAVGPQLLAVLAFDPLTWFAGLSIGLGAAGIEGMLGGITGTQFVVVGVLLFLVVLAVKGGED